jgi:hypothetical protein
MRIRPVWWLSLSLFVAAAVCVVAAMRWRQGWPDVTADLVLPPPENTEERGILTRDGRYLLGVEGGDLVWRSLAVGSVQFRSEPLGYTSHGLHESDGLIIFGLWTVTLLDPRGRVVRYIDGPVGGATRTEDGFVISRGLEVIRLDGADREMWRTKVPDGNGFAKPNLSNICRLSGGDIIAIAYCVGTDAPIVVCRFDGRDGTLQWSTSCRTPRRRGHDWHYHQRAWVESLPETVELPERVRVTCRAQGGESVEVLSVGGGWSLGRAESAR